jgi:hypothetical protein
MHGVDASPHIWPAREVFLNSLANIMRRDPLASLVEEARTDSKPFLFIVLLG